MTVYWTTREGEKLQPEEMTYWHRFNVLAMAVRTETQRAMASLRGANQWLSTGSHPEEALGMVMDMEDILKDVRAYVLKNSEALALMAELNDKEQA